MQFFLILALALSHRHPDQVWWNGDKLKNIITSTVCKQCIKQLVIVAKRGESSCGTLVHFTTLFNKE